MTLATDILEIEHFLNQWAGPQSLAERRTLAHNLHTLFQAPVRAWIENLVKTWPGNEDGRNTTALTDTLLAIRKKDRNRFDDYRRAIDAAEYLDINIRHLPFEDRLAFLNVIKRYGERDTVAAAFAPDQDFENETHENEVMRFTHAQAAKHAIDEQAGRYYLLKVMAPLPTAEARTMMQYVNNTDPSAAENYKHAQGSYAHNLMLWAASAIDPSRRKRLGFTGVPMPERMREPQNPLATAAAHTLNAAMALSIVFAVFAAQAPAETKAALKTFVTEKIPGFRP